MTTRSRSSVYGLDDSLSPTDRELFSLFLQYPEIDFDDQTNTAISEGTIPRQTTDFNSSPLATVTERASNASTLYEASDSDSGSTLAALSPPQKDDHEDVDVSITANWEQFLNLVQQSNLPQGCIRYYTSLGQAIINIGSELFATVRPNRPSRVLQIGEWLLKCVTYSRDQAASQVDKIAHLKTLVAFNVTPVGSCLWTTYMQRAKLITANLALPSKHELDLLHSLVLIYNSYLYSDFVSILGLHLFDEQTCTVLDDIYHILMTWLRNYKQWCRGMAELRYRYMRPLIDEFAKLPEAQDEFNDFQERITKAKSALSRPVDAMVDLSDEVVQRLNLSARRKDGATGLRRSRTRYKREHTL